MCDYSLIIPVYNNSSFLKDVDEYLTPNKKFENRFEAILVDDGSTDDSLEICKKIAQRKSFVKICSETHAGISAARNVGLKNASGRIILFADCDDLLDCNGLLDFLDRFPENDLYIFSFKQGNDQQWKKVRCLQDEIVQIKSSQIEMFLEKYYKQFAGSVWNKAYKKNIIDEIGLQFISENEIGNEDILFNLMYLFHCQTVCFSDEMFYFYRIWSGSASHRKERGLSIIHRFCQNAVRLRQYALTQNIEMPEFFFYFLIKQMLLAQRSCLNLPREKSEGIANLFLGDSEIVQICTQTEESGQVFWENQENLSKEKYEAIVQIQKMVTKKNSSKLEIAIRQLLLS